MNLNKPQSKPQQDEVPTFSLSEQRQVDPPVAVSQKFGSERKLEDRIVDIFQADILPAMQAPTGEQDDAKPGLALAEQIASANAEIRSLMEQVKLLSENAQAQQAEASAKAEPAVSAANNQEEQPRGRSHEGTGSYEGDSQAREDKIPEIDTGGTGSYEGDSQAREDRLKEKDEKDESKDESKDDPDSVSESSEDSIPVALDVRGKIYIPDVTPFEIWDKISTEAGDGWNHISLQCTVSNLQITGHTFIDEFSPGTIEDMVVFNGSDKQTQFTMPLAERINAQGNSWMPCTQGGIYHLPVFCVSGKPAIFPNKLT